MAKQGVTEAVVILDDVRSAENVGSILRTADACGVSRVYLTGYTPTPQDRFGRPTKVIKASLGAERSVKWSAGTLTSVLTALRREGFFIVAVEQSPRSIDYKKIPKRRKIAFIFGNEVEGISTAVLKKADAVAEIGMLGRKESLNVAVAAGMVLSRTLGI